MLTGSHLPTPDSSTFTHQPHQQYTAYPMDIAPLPYSFLSSYMPPEPLTEPTRPPTPISIADPHTPSSPMDFFNNFISTTLDRVNQGSSPPNTDDGPPTPSRHRSSSVATAPSSVSSTPSLARAMSRAHFTPEASPGPSPSKRQKIGQFSPTPRTKSLPSSNIKRVTLKVGSSSQPLAASSSLTSIGSSASTPKGNSGSRNLLEVEIPVRGKSQTVEDEEESEEDDLDWDEEPTIDADGDWNMENEIGRKSSERWDARGAPPGSGRTGDRDARSKPPRLGKLEKLTIQHTFKSCKVCGKTSSRSRIRFPQNLPPRIWSARSTSAPLVHNPVNLFFLTRRSRKSQDTSRLCRKGKDVKRVTW